MTAQQVPIREVYVDPAGNLRIIPALPPERNYDSIYRDAMSVYWDHISRALYTTPRDSRSVVDGYRQILASVAAEYGDALVLTADTWWSGVSPEDRAEIAAASAAHNGM